MSRKPFESHVDAMCQGAMGARTLMAVLDSMNEGVALIDPQQQVLFQNATLRSCGEAERLDELLEAWAGQCTTPEQQQDKIRELLAAFESGGRAEMELEMKCAEQRVVKLTLNPIARGEQHVGALLICRDITRLKHADVYLRAIAEATPIPLIVTRRSDGRILYCNEECAQLVQLKASALIGRASPDFYWDTSDRDRMLAELQAKGAVRDFEVRIRRQDGSPRWVIFTIVPVTLAGEALLLAGIYDITHRKDIEAALGASEERFRSYVENATDLIFALDRHGQLTYVSPNLRDVLGYQPLDLLGGTLERYTHENDYPLLWNQLERLKSGNRERQFFEFRLRHRDGRVRWFRSALAPLNSGNGALTGVTGIAHDVSDNKQMVEKLEHANQSLRDAQLKLIESEKLASLGMLMGGLAHEINTPIGAVGSMNDTIRRALEKLETRLADQFPEARRDPKIDSVLKLLADSSRVVADGATRVTGIVRRLRGFSCAEDNALVEVDLCEILNDTLALVWHELKHHVVIHKRFGSIPRIKVYPGRLNQVFVNLLINAGQAIEKEGTITVSAEQRGANVEIGVADTGRGIPPTDFQRIFENGFTTRRDEGGTGLGLAISKEIVDAHHGSIRVESVPGRGTTFTVVLPTNLAALVSNDSSTESVFGCRH